MKYLLLVAVSLTMLISCKKNEEKVISMNGEWYWYKTLIKSYDGDGIMHHQSQMDFLPYNINDFNANGIIYAGALEAGDHNHSSQAHFTNTGNATFNVVELTATTMTLKEFPPEEFINSSGNFFNCVVQERYYRKD